VSQELTGSSDAWDHNLKKLCEDGYVHIPQFLDPALLKNACAAVDAAFEEAPYGRNERTGEIEPASRSVGLGNDVDLLSIIQLRDKSLNSVPLNPSLHSLFEKMLGNDFYLDRAVVRRARGKCDRFYFHKDQHGDIGLTILLNDLDKDEGATTVLPGRHLGTPPSLYRIRNINPAHLDEVQMTGKAGDAYLFIRDIDHSRAQNLTDKANTQLILAFVNKNTFPAAHSKQDITQEDMKDLDPILKHMLRPYDGEPSDSSKGFVEKYLYGGEYSSPGGGDYDVRNDLFRDFVYTMFYVKGKPLRSGPDAALPRNTTWLNEIKRVSFLQYITSLDWWLVLRNLSLKFLRTFKIGDTLISALKKFRRRQAGK
jgi:ectoine hydroxylase-related dioxygenase (phytanoyl-CoA dioxygenase family)